MEDENPTTQPKQEWDPRFVEAFIETLALFAFGIAYYFLLTKCGLTVDDNKCAGSTLWGKALDVFVTLLPVGAFCLVGVLTHACSRGRHSLLLWLAREEPKE